MVHFSSCRACGDYRQHDLWYASMHSAWDAQLPSLIEVYLLWKHPPATIREESQGQAEHVFHVTRVAVFGVFFPCHLLHSNLTHSRLASKVCGSPVGEWTRQCVSHSKRLTWMHSNLAGACNHIPVLGTVPSAATASIFIWHPGLHKSALCITWSKSI